LVNRELCNVSRETSTLVDKFFHIYEDMVKIYYIMITADYSRFSVLP
jgi:hypothetical protein